MDLSNNDIYKAGLTAGRKELMDHIIQQFEYGKPMEINGKLFWLKDEWQKIKMLKRANINWTIKQLNRMTQNASIRFDNTVQRGYVWDTKRKSLLIHSILVGYPIPAFYAAKNENGYDMLDGKQRTNDIVDFIRKRILSVKFYCEAYGKTL